MFYDNIRSYGDSKSALDADKKIDLMKCALEVPLEGVLVADHQETTA